MGFLKNKYGQVFMDVWTNGVFEQFDKKTGQCFKGIDVKQYFIDTIPHTLEYLNKAIALPSKN